MSQPNPKKQRLDPNFPEFPGLPRLTLAAVAEFASKSQVAVEFAVQNLNSTPTPSALFLPRISPHGLQYRFAVENDDVFVIIRTSYYGLKEGVRDVNLKKDLGLGPVGIGKSYLLYLLAAEYRANRQRFRVTYINDCAEWISDKIMYILREFVVTFYDDTIDGKSVVEWCQEVPGGDQEGKMTKMIMALVDYVKDAKLEWIVICDQQNALFKNGSVIMDFPFNLIDYLSKKRGSSIKVVISASANNEGYPTQMRGWLPYDISSHRFDEGEFATWCHQYPLEGDTPVDPTHEDAIDALYWSGNYSIMSGGVPHELDLLWRKAKRTLMEKVKEYRKDRVKEMATIHANFYDKLSDNRKKNLDVCISRMALGLSPPGLDGGMDRQIFDIVKDTDGLEIITALNPVAREALIAYHNKSLLTPLSLAAEIVFAGTYTNDTKGRIIERYLVTMLELSKRFDITSRKSMKSGISKKHVRKVVQIQEVIHFSGNKLPLPASFSRTATTLFIPESPNYPRVDFFIWDSVGQVLMAFQVTITKDPLKSHSKFQKGSNLYTSWQVFCGMDKTTPIEMYWIIPEIGKGKPNFDDHVVTFEDLKGEFPALQKLRLIPESV